MKKVHLYFLLKYRIILFLTRINPFPGMFGFNNSYYIILALQAICVIHCIKKGNDQKWIWLIIFIPMIGCVIYFFSEILNGSNVKQAQFGIGNLVNPSGSIKKLEKQLNFADTFNNRVALADAYLSGERINEAISLYENSLTGAFTENEHVLNQLVIAYYHTGRFEDVLRVGKKLYKRPQFLKSKAHVLYALALEKTGNTEAAEAELKTMQSRFANFDARCQYGYFLQRAGRYEEAAQIFQAITNEFPELSPPEKRANRSAYNEAKGALKKAAVM